MTAAQDRIDNINRLVDEYKAGSEQSAHDLIEAFEPFLKKQTTRFMKYYPGVHSRDHALHEAMVIFCDLMREYTPGGPAYFTVFIQRKLPLRLRYFFIKEIKRRSRDLSHSDEQFSDKGLIGADESDLMEVVIDEIVGDEKLKQILQVIHDGATLDERELDMVTSSVVKGESHKSIADRYGISRSRVSRIIKLAIEKVQGEVTFRE